MPIRSLLVVAALSLALVAPSAASIGCRAVAPGVTACDPDGDGVPTIVFVAVDGVGAVGVVFVEVPYAGGTYTNASAFARTSGDGPAGSNGASASLVCIDYGSGDRCRYAYVDARAWSGPAGVFGRALYVDEPPVAPRVCVEDSARDVRCFPIPLL